MCIQTFAKALQEIAISMKSIGWRVCLVLAPAVVVLTFACGEGAPEATDGVTETETPLPVPSPFPGISSEVVVPKAEFPVVLAFAPDGRLFYNERNTGNVRVVTPDGQLLEEPFLHVDVAFNEAMPWGLVGLALDPDFETNHYVYIYFTEPVGEDRAKPVIMRFTDVNNRGSSGEVVVDDLPQARLFGEYYVGGNIHFGPQGYLYVPIGDFDSSDLAQDLNSVRGKILRINKEHGSAAPDNPFVNQPGADPRVFAYGLLWPYDFAFDPRSGEMFVTERGFYFCCDELNVIRGGQDYGWAGTPEEAVPPIYGFALPDQTTEASKVYPAGIEFVSSDDYPALGDSLLVCEEGTKYMRRLSLTPSRNHVESDDIVVADCQLDIAVSPDGVVYYSNATEIRRLVPQ